MCGIFACFGEHCDRMAAVENAHKQIHRGPDDFICQKVTGFWILVHYLCFYKLIVCLAEEVCGSKIVRVDNKSFLAGGYFAFTRLNIMDRSAVSYTHLTLPTIYSV